MNEILDDQYNTSCEESDKTDSSDEQSRSSSDEESSISSKSDKLKRKRVKKKGIFYNNLDLIRHCFDLLIFIIFIIGSRKQEKNLSKRRKLYTSVTDMDKDLRDALRVTKNFVFNYFYYNKT